MRLGISGSSPVHLSSRGAKRRSNLGHSVRTHLVRDCFVASLLTRNPVRFGVTFIVMAGPVPAIRRGTLPLQMAGTGPAMPVRAGFIQGGSATAGRCGTRNDNGIVIP